jgi:prepilin-type processing-associated H-X9-DG protein
MNYESAFGTFPIGRNQENYINTSGGPQGWHDGWGELTQILQFTEQAPLYFAINIGLGPYQVRNSTYAGVGISLYWCPSDASIIGLRFYEQCAGWDCTTVPCTYTSYAGMMGTYTPGKYNGVGQNGRYVDPVYLNQENGLFPDVGLPTWYGGRGTRSPVKLAEITDGTSNTFAFGEKAKSRMSKAGCAGTGCCDFECEGWWADGSYGDASMASFYPPNVLLPSTYYATGSFKNPYDQGVAAGKCDNGDNIPTVGASSMHPGGVNFAFADGSVHFIKNTISTWNWQLIPRNGNAGCTFTLPAGVSQGIYQSLSTIAGGEVISADAY